MAPLDKEKVLTVLKQKGPLVPNDLKKEVGGDTMILGAVLSELSSRGLAKITDVKKGSSPFYYVAGQEAKIEGLMEYLNPKDQEIVRRLKENKVLADKSQELIVRVGLRKAKDYAIQLQVNTSQGPMLFWRYYLVPEQEAMGILKSRYNTTVPQEAAKEAEPAAPKAVKFVPGQAPPPTPVPAPPPAPKPVVQAPAPTPAPRPVERPQPVAPVKPAQPKPVEKQTPITKPQVQEEKKTEVARDSQQPLSAPPRLEKTPFYVGARNYFEENKIKVLDELQVAKEREYEFRLRIPSAVGDLEMYCVARNKKKLTQDDVAGALLKAKKRDLQLFYLTNGVFTKKSLQIISTEYKGVILKTF